MENIIHTYHKMDHILKVRDYIYNADDATLPIIRQVWYKWHTMLAGPLWTPICFQLYVDLI